MQQDFRALAWRHMWLSWWWGILIAWFAEQARELLPQDPSRHSIDVLRVLNQGVSGPFYLLLAMLLYLSLPALLGALIRQPLMRRVFANANSTPSLLLYTVLVFEGCAVLFWLLWELFIRVSSPALAHSMQRLNLHLLTVLALSLPWLLSSATAAWWLGRQLFPRKALSGN